MCFNTIREFIPWIWKLVPIQFYQFDPLCKKKTNKKCMQIDRSFERNKNRTLWKLNLTKL